MAVYRFFFITRLKTAQLWHPILISTSFRACSEYPPSDTYAARTHKPDCNHYRINQIAITTGPRPTHGPPTALHQPANNHPQTNNSAYPRALKRRGGRRRTPPTTTTIGNTSTRTQTNKAGLLTLLNLSPRHQNYTTPPHHHHRGLPPGAATPPTYPSISVVSATTVVST